MSSLHSDPSTSDPTPAASTPPVFPVILGWCLWLIGAWAVTFLSSASLIAADRWMSFAAAMGLLLIWPAWRLSLEIPSATVHPLQTIGHVWIEWLALNLVLQAVIWTLPVGSGWSFQQTLWLDAALASWSLLIAAIVAAGTLAASPPRQNLAMLGCLLILFGQPLLQALGWISHHTTSPLNFQALNVWTLLYQLTRPPEHFRPESYLPRIAPIVVLDAALWLILVLWSLLRPFSSKPKNPT